MPRIELLPAAVASRIAAGEVLDRPASLLKELIENALDAGARKIAVESQGAGKESLRVTDDGQGMDREDCERCLERHATSKISRFEDLDRLSTYGFRGEALYAAAAVSRLSIATCQPGTASGWKIEAEAGRLISSQPAAAVFGTTVQARDLFFNTPARRQFLKSDQFENAKLAAAIEEAALANPQVHFTYKSQERLRLAFAPEKSADPLERDHERLKAVLGPEVALGLLPVVAERPGFRLRMFLSAAARLVATRHFQFWFVNRRPIETRILQQAIYRAYREHRSADRHPVVVGFLELPGESFDVNVHPGKREVRFKSEREIFDLICGLAASALYKSVAAPSIIRAESVGAFTVGGRTTAPVEPFLNLEARPSEGLQASSDAPRWFTPPYRYLGQIEKSYLVFEAAGGLFVLDQHAAAERILFEKFLSEIEAGGAKSQQLLLPVTVELPASAVTRVLNHSRRLSALGFEIEPLGKTALRVTAVPALFQKAAELKDLVHRALESFEDPASSARDLKHDALATIACKAAVKAHDALGESEALQLLEDLKDCADGSCCPHGRRALLALNREDLARRFQRPGAPPL